MNVTMITGSPDVRCGVGTYTIRLLCALSKISNEINLTCLAPFGKRPEQLEASINYVNASPGREFREYIRQNRSEILHLQFPSATLAFYGYWRYILFCRVFYGNYIIITAHEPISKRWILAPLAASKILSVRGRTAIPFWKRFNPQTVIPVQNPPMLPKVATTSEQCKKIRSQLGIQQGKKLVSFLGFLTPAVRLEWMLESCNPREHDLVIMGQIPSQITSNTIELYELLCRKYGWDPQRVLKGYVPDLQAAEILAASDVVFLPYSNGCQESINTSYLAARQQGTYIVTTSKQRCGYDASLNTYFVPVGETETFKEALDFLPKANKPHISNIMTWETLAELHLDVYKQIAGKTKRKHHA